VERPAGKKQLKRKAKPKISPADTGGRDSDPMSADTPTDLPAQFGLSAKSADTHIAYPPQAGESTTSADTPEDVPAAPEDLSAPLEGIPGTPEQVTTTAAHADDMAGFPDGMLCKPEDVTATADTSDGVADK
jgi:hypothetical protein